MYGALLVSLLFVVVGVSMIWTGELFGWIVVVLFGAAGLVIARSLKRPAVLELTPVTMTLRPAGGGQPLQYDWRRCGEFHPWGRTLLNRGSLVVFDYAGALPAPTPKPLRTMNRALRARDANVPAIFGMSCPEMAYLLNGYRMQAHFGA